MTIKEETIINEESIISLVNDLVSIYSPYFKEKSVMTYVHNWLERNNIPVIYHSYEDKKVTKFEGINVIGSIDGGSDGPKVLLNGHLDTVQICQGWNTEPTVPVVKGNKLYGLGALDMKSGVGAMMLALKAFTKKYKNFNGSIVYSFVSDEEGPYGLGTNFLIHDQLINDADVAIVPEPSSGFTGENFPCLCLGARGGYSYKVVFKGVSSHAANPEKGVSAIVDASKVVTELKKLSMKKNEHLGKGDICIIEIKGGGAACSVADQAEFTVFRHIVIGENKKTLEKEVDQAVKNANIKSDYEVIFRDAPTPNSDGFLPYLVDESNEYTQSFIESIEKVTNKKPNISYFSSIGDFNYIGSRLKIPTFVFGPGGERYHSSNEYVNIDDVLKTSQIIYDYLERLLVK
ncbi:MAG: M20/M25/M40 family metallo-hydrolase [Bacillota bacterium]|nr:M20/M25/M40 family metallo-hydrolase [Bacillota bacterium]